MINKVDKSKRSFLKKALAAIAAGTVASGAQSSNKITLGGSGDNDVCLDPSGTLSTDTKISPNVDGGGLCLNTGGNDGHVLSIKNSEVTHSFTSFADTNTYPIVTKISRKDK